MSHPIAVMAESPRPPSAPSTALGLGGAFTCAHDAVAVPTHGSPARWGGIDRKRAEGRYTVLLAGSLDPRQIQHLGSRLEQEIR